jgi:hypothetical protein
VTRVEQIEREIQELSAGELSVFRHWFQVFDAEAWDRQVEEDVRSGKLDRLADDALRFYKAGECSEL